MTKQKSTKRALLLSALSLLVCVSMLIGSTFAWFTDSVTTGSNVIKSGTLEVDLIDEQGQSLAGQVLKFVDQDENDLWEPGCTYNLQKVFVANKGNLALKYEIAINGITGDAKLLEAIEWTVTIDNVTKSLDELNGYLLPNEKSKAIVLSGHMKEEATNEYQGLSVEGISISVFATQYTYEADSFDDQYDKDATFGTCIELNAGDDLLAAMASAEKGVPLTIKLNGDVEWPTEGHHGENDITPAFSILIDGNGHTITATGSGVTPLGDTEAPMTLKNVKIVDKSQSYAESSWEFTYLELGGTALTCDNVTFADEIQTGTKATFTNCSFESNEENVYAVWVEDGSASFTNCTFTGYRGLKAHEAYGTDVSSVIVKNCTFSEIASKPGIALGTLNANTTVSITDSTFIRCQPGDQGLYIYESDTDVNTIKFTNKNNKVVNVVTVSTAAALETAINNAVPGTVVTLANNLTFSANDTTANSGYGATGISVNGGVLDGNGKTLTVNDANGTWDCAVNAQSGTIKNLTVSGAFRGIFMSGASGDVYIDNVIIDNVCYPFNSDAGSKDYGVYISNSTLNGWTSFSNVHKEVVFTNCKFGKGTGAYQYAYCRPYNVASFVNCDFAAGYTMDPRAAVTFENCTIGGQPLTAANLGTLVTDNIGNATVK